MKRFMILLIVLVLLGAAVFGVGYVPIRVPAGTVAVLHSRTSGWDPQPIVGGVFAWRWQLLIPTNTTIHLFPVEPQSVRIRSTTLLPSADLYRSYLEGQPDLSQEVAVRISYRITPDTLAQLAPAGMQPDGLAEWYRATSDELGTTALAVAERAIRSGASTIDETGVTAVAAIAGTLSEEIGERILSRRPDIELTAVVVEELRLPDLDLYRQGREIYNTVNAAREAALTAAVQNAAVRQANLDQRIDTLERYGEIMTSFPVLLEYLDIAARHGSDPLDLDLIEELNEAAQ